ncbi:MAG: MFS transporter [Kurthia sp.]|nr:MFS transporter [Candidatus Kurthia equi]
MTGNTAKIPLLGNPVYPIMIMMGICHLFNDTLQAVIPAMFPILKSETGISFTQLGWISFALNMVASVLQPVVGLVSDRKPRPYALPIGMCFSFVGIAGVAFFQNYWLILASVIFLGFGSAIFHPEGSRVSFMAAGAKRGLSQSIYQVGGNTGQALAPLISAFVLVPFGQIGAAWFLIVAAIGIFTLSKVSSWYKKQLAMEAKSKNKKSLISSIPHLTKRQLGMALTVLLLIIFVRSFYVTNITNFFVFHLTKNYGMTIQHGQMMIFLFLAVGALGTFFGGPFADRLGKKYVIILSILVPLPFSLILPHASLLWMPLLIIIIGFFLMLSFSVTVVYAQELVPNRIGLMSGLTVGLAFGMGAIGAVVIGILMDNVGVATTMTVISLLPFLGLIGFFLPKDEKIA